VFVLEEPVYWNFGEDFAACHRWLLAHGERRAAWAGELHDLASECFTAQDDFWLVRSDWGAIRFRADNRQITAYSAEGVGRAYFRRLAEHYWLPLVYYFWGRQVIHAAAVVHLASGQAVALAGRTHAGKSTLGYALGRQPGWQQFADDTLAFVAAANGVRLVPLPNEVRLRRASAEHYRLNGHTPQPLLWPNPTPELKRLYFLEPDDGAPARPSPEPVPPKQALPLLYEQAFVLSLELPQQQGRLMRDYLLLLQQASFYRLAYRRGFAALAGIVETVKRHALA
jgi:hypothetical protein